MSFCKKRDNITKLNLLKLVQIKEEIHFNYEVLVNALNLRYGEEHMKQINWFQLRNREQRLGESTKQLAQDIERLTLLSYPQRRKETGLEAFVKAVRDSNFRQTLILADNRSLKDVVAYSLTFESAKQASKTDANFVKNIEDIYNEIVNNALETITVASVQNKRLEDDPASRPTVSNREAGCYLKANFAV
ncbi:hypothetical protein HELRODRAFT_165128 [Helobdella robusta]|uniref:Uncharacterized protein n=1 Tax=Helobdella robusta TaxID=6412 RepID=T1EWB3_HELRO|nr:hypothetical protein HELRODRAFT_165128 [Helobdella robusta]ESN92982.1 hypothetical protein HELRODRAFT_165128 [Helobdella robusta]